MFLLLIGVTNCKTSKENGEKNRQRSGKGI